MKFLKYKPLKKTVGMGTTQMFSSDNHEKEQDEDPSSDGWGAEHQMIS